MASDDELKQELERLRAENAALKSAGQRNLSFKVSEKGAISVYGMGRFPVTLYVEQWNTLLDSVDALRAFMRDHDTELKHLERR
jgi:hypothetical protein